MKYQQKRIDNVLWVIFFLIFSVGGAVAQIKVTFPVERAIFQRDASNQATLNIGGYYTQATDRVEARLVPVLQGQGQETPWTVLQNNPTGGVYFGKLAGRGGWYTLEVRSFLKGIILGRDAIGRVGIGEVFIIAGQSNAEGIPNFGSSAPTDDRVNTIVYNNRDASSLTDPTNFTFTPITAEGIIGPRGRSAWCWGSLGDLLAKRLNVPILFMNVGWESTPIKSWLDSANGLQVANAFGPGFLPAGMPYANLKTMLRYYGSVLGVRAVLWLQGETDNFLKLGKEEYQRNLQALINIARADQGDGIYVPWILSRTSRIDIGVSQNIIDGQNGVIASEFNKVYGGPFTDPIQATTRDNGVHFRNAGLIDLARAWDSALQVQLFSAAVPLAARPAQALSVSCNSTNASMNVKAPNGFVSYKWSNGQTDQTITVSGAGTYQATMKDRFGNTFFTQALTLTEPVLPATPVITPGGEQQICTDSSLVLSINTSSLNTITWSNDQTGNGIIVKPGTFTARVTNIYGCSSAVSAPVTVRNITIQAPKVQQLGPYTIQALPDSTIFGFKDTKVSKLTWDWRQDGKGIAPNKSPIKVTQSGTYSVRSRVLFDAPAGGSARTCLSPYSTAVEYKMPTTDDGIILYPNPNNSGFLAIEALRDLINVEITVTNLAGQFVYGTVVPMLNERKVLNLTQLTEGAYLVKFTSSGLNQTKRIIIDY